MSQPTKPKEEIKIAGTLQTSIKTPCEQWENFTSVSKCRICTVRADQKLWMSVLSSESGGSSVDLVGDVQVILQKLEQKATTQH